MYSSGNHSVGVHSLHFAMHKKIKTFQRIWMPLQMHFWKPSSKYSNCSNIILVFFVSLPLSLSFQYFTVKTSLAQRKKHIQLHYKPKKTELNRFFYKMNIEMCYDRIHLKHISWQMYETTHIYSHYFWYSFGCRWLFIIVLIDHISKIQFIGFVNTYVLLHWFWSMSTIIRIVFFNYNSIE